MERHAQGPGTNPYLIPCQLTLFYVDSAPQAVLLQASMKPG